MGSLVSLAGVMVGVVAKIKPTRESLPESLLPSEVVMVDGAATFTLGLLVVLLLLRINLNPELAEVVVFVAEAVVDVVEMVLVVVPKVKSINLETDGAVVVVEESPSESTMGGLNLNEKEGSEAEVKAGVSVLAGVGAGGWHTTH